LSIDLKVLVCNIKALIWWD